MKDVIFLIFYLLTILARLLRPSGGRATIAENLLLKQQLIIHSRSSKPPHNLTHSTNPTPGIYPKALQGIIGVEYVMFVGCK